MYKVPIQMSRSDVQVDWREGRRQAARAAIVEAAWSAVREVGLAGLSMRDLARRAGITTPTVYAYFDSKNDVYDAMFGQAAAEFDRHMAAPFGSADPRQVMEEGVRRFMQFCIDDPARYQLLFQRTIPGFEPSEKSFAHSVATLEGARRRLAAAGVHDARHVDMWTALLTGLVDQQISNDPGGDRWSRLIDDAVEMFLQYIQGQSSAHRRRPARPNASF